MKLRDFTFGAVVLAALPFGVGCEQSVQDAKEDVQDAQIEAQHDVQEEKQDVEQAKVEGAQDVQEEQQDVREAQTEEAQDAEATTTP
jgi:hypothetical protein